MVKKNPAALKNPIIFPFPWDRVRLSWGVLGMGTAFSFLKGLLSARKVDVDTTHDSMELGVPSRSHEREEEAFTEKVASKLSLVGQVRV